MPVDVVIVTLLPSPYQVELLDQLASEGRVEPSVVYLQPSVSERLWSRRVPRHSHVILPEGGSDTVERQLNSASFVVFSNYTYPVARRWMAERAVGGRPWCYWGERPGFSRWKWLSRLRRRVYLRSLRRSVAPVWGMGGWAVDAWRTELGAHRKYVNLPYFSDLSRFARPASRPDDGTRRLLFSGSLIHRKGVDLLAEAFASVARTRPHLHLELVGTGELEPILRQKFAEYGDRVRFAGFLDWAELSAAYHRADVLVAPSRYDGWGLIVPEGLAAGLPVIGTDRTGAALDLLRPGENGWLTRAGDLASLTAAVQEAADLPAERLAEMGSAATYFVTAHQLADGARRFADAAEEAIRDWSRSGRS